MKRLICTVLASLMLLSATACGKVSPDTSATATASAPEQLLIDRLGSTEGLILGTSDAAAEYGIDMTDFRDEGYIIRSEGAETLIFGKTEKGLDRAVRYYANNCTEGGILNITYGEGYRVKQITIAGRDISEYSIYLFEGADQCHTMAAAELQNYISLACGITLPIVNAPAEHNIVLEQVGLDDPRSEVLGREGFNISVRDDGELYISGGRDRGCLYGVYELLEAYIGWRFAANGEVLDHIANANDFYLYEAEHIDIPAGLEDEQVPSFDYRQGRLYAGGQNQLYYSNLPVILRENDLLRGKAAYNGYGYARGANHGLLIGPIRNDYISDEIVDDNVKNNFRQPCFTSDLLLEGSIEYYTEYIESCLAAGQRIGEELVYIDIAQVDSGTFCMCETCVEYFVLDGSHTGPMLYFANAIAEHFSEIYPELYYSILVYWGTTEPPKVTKPHPKLNCSYCFYNDMDKYYCANHSISGVDCTGKNAGGNNINNYEYAEEFERWCEIAGMVTVWYYPGSWYFNSDCASRLKTLREDYKYLADHGVHGVYPCMISPASWNSEDSLIGYLIDKLQWNAEMTDEEYFAMIEEYFMIFYGEVAAGFLMDYILWEIDAASDYCWTLQAFSTPDHRLNFSKVQNDFEYCIALFDMAGAAAESEAQERGIIKFSLPLYFTGLMVSHTDMYLNGTEAQRERYTEIYEHFKKIALENKFNVDGRVLTEADFNIEKNFALLYKYIDVEDRWWE